MSFISVLETIAKNFEKDLSWAVQYAVPVERLVGTLFPPANAAMTEAEVATTLIQNAVLLVEQKYAATKAQKAGTQKLAEVLLLTQPVVTGLLTKAGIPADTGYITKLVTAVVAVLNVQQATVAATA